MKPDHPLTKIMSTTENKSILQPYLNFGGRAEEAIEFYKTALGAEVALLFRFKDNPTPGQSSPEVAEKVMHANLRIGQSTLLLSDGRCTGSTEFKGVSLSLIVADEAEAGKRFAALAEGGEVQMPLAKTFFSPSFGMVEDKFGVGWMVLVQSPETI
jgi:PhnB protein